MRIQIALASNVLTTVLNTTHNASFKERLKRLTLLRLGIQLDSVHIGEREKAVLKQKESGYTPYAGFVVYWKGEWCIDPHLFCVKNGHVYEVTNAYSWADEIYYFGEPAGDNLKHALTRVMRVT